MKLAKIREVIKKYETEIYFLFALTLLFFWIFLTAIPKNFQKNTLVEVTEGESLGEISKDLHEKGLIRSHSFFSLLLIIRGQDDNVVAGDYLFHEPIDVFEIASRMVKGDYGIEPRSVTLAEGFTLEQMSFRLDQIYPKFDPELFDELTKGLEGYLFPDTYSFPENVETEKIVMTLRENFDLKIKEVSKLIEKSDKSLEDIIIMASIIEKESTADGRQEVSSILWKRLELGMPLQVDAAFVYEIGKGTFDLTMADLKADTPYNTYVNLGLPPTAIANPGLDAIKAAADPLPTENLYFLTGMDGAMYYADTFENHKKNRRLYLDV